MRIGLLLIASLIAGSLKAGEPVQAVRPRISLIIDDLGNRMDLGLRALELPGPVSYAFLPHTPFAQRLAKRAHSQGKTVMVHLPMESDPPHRLGPDGLTANQQRKEFRARALRAIRAIPFAQGVNNHMGSRLTRERQPMEWLMQTLSEQGPMFFVDSRTTVHTVAEEIARRHGLPATRRDVLDNQRESTSIEYQLRRLLVIARNKGHAVAIGHPYPETLTALEHWLPDLRNRGFDLVAVEEIVRPEAPSPSGKSFALLHRLKDQHLMETEER